MSRKPFSEPREPVARSRLRLPTRPGTVIADADRELALVVDDSDGHRRGPRMSERIRKPLPDHSARRQLRVLAQIGGVGNRAFEPGDEAVSLGLREDGGKSREGVCGPERRRYVIGGTQQCEHPTQLCHGLTADTLDVP